MAGSTVWSSLWHMGDTLWEKVLVVPIMVLFIGFLCVVLGFLIMGTKSYLIQEVIVFSYLLILCGFYLFSWFEIPLPYVVITDFQII